MLAIPESTAESIGDEPYQIHQKFPSVTVAVDEKRCHGIEELLALEKPSIEIDDDTYRLDKDEIESRFTGLLDAIQ